MCFFCSILHFHRYRLTSASDEEDWSGEDESAPMFDDYEEHMQYMAARERLQEFPGRIPPRKKRDHTNNSNAQTRRTRVSQFYNFSLIFFTRFRQNSGHVVTHAIQLIFFFALVFKSQ